MRRNIGVAAFVAAGACAIGGCTNDGDTFIQNVISAFGGNFPGAPVSTHQVATDSAGLNEPSGAVAPTGVRYFPSGDGATGIVLYNSATVLQNFVYAHYFDGSRFTPPVRLGGGNQNGVLASSSPDWAVVFVNQAGQARHGDAVILWRQMDLDDFNTSTSAGPNRRLYYSYFDRSAAGQAASGTNGRIQYGFDSIARTVGTNDDTGVHVTCYGVFSDGLHGRAIWAGDAVTMAPGQGFNFFEQGDPTTFLGVSFVQPSSTTTTPGLLFATFDLSASNTTNQFGSPSNVPSDGTFATGATGVGDSMFDIIETYDGSVFPLYFDQSATDGNRYWNVFGSAAATSGFLTSSALLHAGDGNNNNTGFFRGLVGPDEGLVNLVGVTEVSGINNAGDVSLFAFQFDTIGGGAYSPANDRVEIDADPLNAGDSTVRNNTSTPPLSNPPLPDPEARLNRSGEFLLVTWCQERGNAVATTDDGLALWAQGIQLTRTGTAPAINTRLTGGSGGNGAQQVDGITTGDATTTDQVQRVKFQSEIGYRSRGKQSDRYTLHLLWQQDETSGTAVDRVRTRGLTFTPSTGASNPVNLSFFSAERTEDFNNLELSNAASNLSPGGWNALSGVDGGGTGGTTGGLILYYVRNITAPASTNAASFRAFQKIGAGTPREIGSLIGGTGASREAATLFVGTTPGNGDIAGSPDYAGTTHHVLFMESRFDNQVDPGVGFNMALRHRTYDKNDTNATIESRFFPTVSSNSPPVTIDNPSGLSTAWPLVGGAGALQSVAANGGTVAAVFGQGGRLYYQEYNPLSRSWLTTGGLSAPEVVDHESSGAAVVQLTAVNQPVGTSNQDLSRFMIFWTKTENGMSRLQVRVRD